MRAMPRVLPSYASVLMIEGVLPESSPASSAWMAD